MNAFFWLACQLLPLLLLLACAGGGGSGGATTATLGPVKKDEQVTPPKTTDPGGAVQLIQNHAQSNEITWSADHLTKTVTYVFPDGSRNTLSVTVNPVEQTPALSRSASYPSNWANGDGSDVVTPLVTARTKTYGDGFVEVVEAGTVTKPFLQSTLTALAITDPNAVVRASIDNLPAGVSDAAALPNDYDLRWSKPDSNGPGYANRYANGSWQPAYALNFWGQTLSGQRCFSPCGPNIGQPAAEVIDAWKQGWTGKGVNVLIEDFIDQTHGAITSLLAYRYAPGATLYGLNIGIDQRNHSVVDLGNQTVTGAPVKLGVVNASYVADLFSLTNQHSGWTDAQLIQARINYAPSAVLITNRYQDASYKGQVNYTDAVFTKAAGNDRLRSDQEPINKALADIPAINSRLLIVGALDQAGSTNLPVNMASYSNKAGTDAGVNSRFLLASGTVPFGNGDLAVNGMGVTASSNVGTSYAAPRVAGMVAIVRSKFPNLNASQTASIMLDTARYDTLTCYYSGAGCDKTLYGRGEASLSRALAPVGKLR